MNETRRVNFIFILILLAVNLGVFLPSMKGGFLWDDKYFISENQNLLSPRFLKDFLFSPFGGYSGIDKASRRADPSLQFYRPLTSLSYWLDFKIWGLNPAGFHLTNILLHFLNSVLVFSLLVNLKLSRAASFMSALLFSVFPLHFENVSWISGRTDLLSFALAALSVIFFLRFMAQKKCLHLALSSLFFLASLLAKESAILLPALYLIGLYIKQVKAKDMVLPLLLFAFALVVWITLRRIALGFSPFVYSGRPVIDFFSTLGFYTWKIIFPFNLSVTINPLSVFDNWFFLSFGFAITLFFGVSLFYIVRRRNKPWLFFSFLAFYFFLLASLVLIFSAATISLIAWRFLYLPSAVFIPWMVHLTTHKIRPRAISLSLLFILAVVYAAEIYPKTKLYGQDEASFWLSIQKVEREDIMARFNIGIHTLPQDKDKALRLFENILAQKDHPLYEKWETRIYEELAIFFALNKDFPKAEFYFQELTANGKALSLHATFNYAYYLAFSGKIAEGERIILEKLEAFPRDHFVLTRAAKFYLIIKDYDKARALYARDYEIFPTEQTRRLLEELRTLQTKPK
jgi:hypothetical protein